MCDSSGDIRWYDKLWQHAWFARNSWRDERLCATSQTRRTRVRLSNLKYPTWKPSSTALNEISWIYIVYMAVLWQFMATANAWLTIFNHLEVAALPLTSNYSDLIWITTFFVSFSLSLFIYTYIYIYTHIYIYMSILAMNASGWFSEVSALYP